MSKHNQTNSDNSENVAVKQNEDFCKNDQSKEEIDEKIVQQIEPIIEITGISPEEKAALIVQQIKQTELFSGPLPPPAAIERYNQIIPNGAERIMIMAEKQQEHTMHCEKIGLSGAIEDNDKRSRANKRGQVFAFVLVILLIGVGAFYALSAPELSAIIFKYTIIAIVIVFVLGKLPNFRKSKPKEEEEKEQKNT